MVRAFITTAVNIKMIRYGIPKNLHVDESKDETLPMGYSTDTKVQCLALRTRNLTIVCVRA